MACMDLLTISAMQDAADHFFELLGVVQNRIPEESSIGDPLRLTEHVARLAQFKRKERKEELHRERFRFNNFNEVKLDEN